MTKPTTPGGTMRSETAIDVDLVEADRKQTERARYFNLVQIPRLRFLGWTMLLVLVGVHNRLVLARTWSSVAPFALLVAVYCLLSWVLLRLLYDRLLAYRPGSLFLHLDLVLLVLAVYASGGERSLLFFLPLVRVADQVSTTFARVRTFAHLGVLYYVLLVGYLIHFEGRPISGWVEAAKVLSLYACGLYIAFTARTAEGLRRRVSEAIHLARASILRLRSQSAELERARAAAEEGARLKSEFLANVTHELRTPMNGILGMVDLVLGTDLTEEQKDCLTTAHASAESLLHVIDDVLDLSSIAAGRLALEEIPFRLRATIAESQEVAEGSARSKGLALSVDVASDVPDTVRGDPTRLRQVLDSLLDNAVKFTEHGSVALRVRRAESEPGTTGLRFEVEDTGIGIPPEKQPLVFDAFSQADGSRTRKYGGLGLGLTIASQLVMKMGGAVRLQSEPGRGSTFTFTAYLREAGEEVARQSRSARARPGARILVIDAQPTTRRALERVLAGAGLKPVGVDPDRSALETLERSRAAGSPFSLVILDSQMGDVDGFAVVRRIRGDARLAATAVVMLATAPQRGDAARGHEVGLTAYLAKPVSEAELLAAIAEALSSAERTRAIDSTETTAVSREQIAGKAGPPSWEIVDEDPDPAADIAARFLAEYPLLLEMLRIAVAAGDPQGLANGTLALQKALANFPAAAALEAAAHLGQAREAKSAREAFDLLVEEVEKIVPFALALTDRADRRGDPVNGSPSPALPARPVPRDQS